MQHQKFYLQIYCNSTTILHLVCGGKSDSYIFQIGKENSFHWMDSTEYYAITTEQTDYSLYWSFRKHIILETSVWKANTFVCI